MKRIYFFMKQLKSSIKLHFIKKAIRNNATFVGEEQAFSTSSAVLLKRGSKKTDVILHEHCDMFGVIKSIAGGKVVMHEWSKIGRNSVITAVNKIEIGRDTAIASGVEIIDNNTHPINPQDRRYMRHTPHGSDERSNEYSANAPIIIGENVWIGSNARIQKGITIGDNAIIASNSVVTHDVPANSIAAGNPARIVKTDIDKTTTPIFPLSK